MNTQDVSRRVVVTGMGVASSIGSTVEDLWLSCVESRSGIRPTREDETLPLASVAPVDAFTGKIQDFGALDDSKKKAIRKGVKLMAREIQMGVASAQLALEHAKIAAPLPSRRVGVSFASDYVVTPPQEVVAAMVACREYVDGKPVLNFEKWRELGIENMTPLWQLKYLTNMSASHITIYNEFFGPAFDVTNREASFAVALAEAVETIKSGRADYMIVGATGTRIHPYRFVDALKYGEISPSVLKNGVSNSNATACARPFDARRNGAIPGEGAGAIFIETAESALARGAKIYAEIVGGAHRGVVKRSAQRADLVSTRESLRESFRLALNALVEKTGLKPSELGSVNANARGDVALDAAEALALRDVFGDEMDRIPVASLKGHLGNPGAGSGAIEMIAGLLALDRNALFATLNYEEPDPNCPVSPTREFGVAPGDSFVKLCANSIGQTSAVLARRFE